MDFFVLMILLGAGFYIVVWILSLMPKGIQEVVGDMFRFLLKGK